MSYAKFQPLIYAAAAREALQKATMGPAYGSSATWIVEQARAALTETLRGFVSYVSPGADVSEIQWSDYPTSHFELLKVRIADEEFYDLFRELIAYFKECESEALDYKPLAEIDLNLHKISQLSGILERLLPYELTYRRPTSAS